MSFYPLERARSSACRRIRHAPHWRDRSSEGELGPAAGLIEATGVRLVRQRSTSPAAILSATQSLGDLYSDFAADMLRILCTLGAAAHPAARHRPKPRCHDAHHRLIAPSACRRTPLPALHRCRPAASNRMPYAVDQAEIALSTAAVAPNSPPRSSIRRRLRRPAHPQRRPPHRQIPILTVAVAGRVGRRSGT